MLSVERSARAVPGRAAGRVPAGRHVWRELTALSQGQVRRDRSGRARLPQRSADPRQAEPAGVDRQGDRRMPRSGTCSSFLSDKYDLTFIVDMQAFDQAASAATERRGHASPSAEDAGRHARDRPAVPSRPGARHLHHSPRLRRDHDQRPAPSPRRRSGPTRWPTSSFRSRIA